MSFHGGGGAGYDFGTKERRRLPKVAVLAIVAVVLLAGAFTAYLVFVPETGGSAEASCYLLIDRTSSVGRRDMRVGMNATASAAVDGCAAEDAILQIGYFDQAGLKLNPVGSFELFQPKERSSVKQKALQQKQIDAAKAAVAKVYDVQPGDHRGSDILVAMRMASESLQQSSARVGTSKRQLIVVSDGIQMSNGVTMASFSATTDIPGEVAKVRDLDLLPNLRGVSVYFFGPMNGEAGEADVLVQAFEKKVSDFWAGTVKASGGTLCRYTGIEITTVPGTCQVSS